MHACRVCFGCFVCADRSQGEISTVSLAPDPFAITGEQCLLAPSERMPDGLPTVGYYQIRSAPPATTYQKWAAEREKQRIAVGGDDAAGPNYDEFHAAYQDVNLSGE